MSTQVSAVCRPTSMSYRVGGALAVDFTALQDTKSWAALACYGLVANEVGSRHHVGGDSSAERIANQFHQ